MAEADQANNAPKRGAAPSPNRRRKRTKAEAEALRLKALRDEFGGSPCDPDEPDLPAGLNANAVRCAIKDASQTFRRCKGLRPSEIARRTATICGLSAEQEGQIKAWLEWLKDRRWVLRENDCAPVVAWSRSSVSNAAEWSEEVEWHWRETIERRAKTELEYHTADGSSAAGSDLDLEAGDNLSYGDAEVAVSTSATAGQDHLRPQRSIEGISAPLRRPTVPFPTFRKGSDEWLANQFFGALKDHSDEDLRVAARNLSEDRIKTRTAMERCPQSSRCIVEIFTQLGLPIPRARP